MLIFMVLLLCKDNLFITESKEFLLVVNFY